MGALVGIVFGLILTAAYVVFNKSRKELSAPVVDPKAPLDTPRQPEFEADFSGPSIGLTAFVTEETPPVYSGSGTWATFDRPGGQGQACVDPGPNQYYQTDNGQLITRCFGYGWPIVSTQLFDKSKPIIFEGEFLATLNNPEDWGGLVAFNGELNYKAIYYSKALDGDQDSLTVDIWSTFNRINTGVKVAKGTWNKFTIVYVNGNFTFKLNNVTIATWNTDSYPQWQDRVEFTQNPSVAIFMGDYIKMRTRNLKVWN